MPEFLFEQLAAQWRQVRDEQDRVAVRAKALELERELLERDLVDFMLSQGIEEGLKGAGTTFKVKQKTKAWIPEEVKEEAFQEIEDMGFGHLIKRNIQWQKLCKFVDEQLSAGAVPPTNVKYSISSVLEARRTNVKL